MAGSEEIVRFKAEAEAAANLDHPGIVPIYEIGEHEGQHYFSMGFIEGQSLQDKLRDGPLRPREASELCSKIAQAVAYAHSKGVIHRDLKPANVLLNTDGQPKVTDFGLAKQVESDRDLTRSGAIMGTPNYMPPEQAAGQASRVGPAADVYSLGAILYCLLTGRPPFQAATAVETVMQVLNEEPVAPRTLNPLLQRDLDTICLKCLNKEGERRYKSVDAFNDDLRHFLAGEPIVARPTSRIERAWKWCKRNPRITVTAAFVLFLLSSVAAVVHSERKRNLDEQVKTTIASLNANRGIILPPLTNLEEFPSPLVLAELRRQFEQDDDRKLPLSFALAHYGDLRTEFLLSQVRDAQPEEAANFITALEYEQQKSLDTINAAADAITDQEVSSLRLKSRLAMLNLHLGDHGLAKEMCQYELDPIERTVFIDECSTWLGDPIRLVGRATDFDSGALRSAVCLAMGRSRKPTLRSELESCEQLLTGWHQTQLDAGTHSASGWALRQWKSPLPKLGVGEPAPEQEKQEQIAELVRQVLNLEHEIDLAVQRRGQRKQQWEQQLLTDPNLDLTDLREDSVAHYALDRLVGSDIYNEATGKADARFVGPSEAKRAKGVVNQDLEIADLAYVDAGQIFQPETDRPFTAGCWFLQELIENRGGKERGVLIAKHRGDQYRGVYLGIFDDTIAFLMSQNQRSRLKVVANFKKTESRWHHLMVTYDGSGKASGVSLYLNGQELETRIGTIGTRVNDQPIQKELDSLSGSVATEAPVTIGNVTEKKAHGYDLYGGTAFSGRIDDVRFYSRVLSQDDVSRIYRRGLRAVAGIPRTQRTTEQNELMLRAHAAHDQVERRLKESHVSTIAKVTAASWDGLPEWRVSPAGLTLLRLPAGRFVTREPLQLNETKTVTVKEGFLISDREIHYDLYFQFLIDPDYPDEEKPVPDLPRKGDRYGRPDASIANSPIDRNWFEAVMFCNWLSHREGLEPCYERTGKKALDLQMKETEYDAWRLRTDANGYRLPTSAEWEYACRAGTTTKYSFGDNLHWIDEYAVRRADRAEYCASRMPNGWGLFDMHGNVEEWCHDAVLIESSSIQESIGKPLMRVSRGGSWFSNTPVGSDEATSVQPAYSHLSRGFRVVVIPHKRYDSPR